MTDSHKHLEMGIINKVVEKSIVYNSDVETGMFIKIHAINNMDYNIEIHNTITKEHMIIDSDIINTIMGTKILSGDDIEISTSPGKKYIHLIRNGIVYNILNTLTIDSTWLLLRRGDNLISMYSPNYGLLDLQIQISHYTLYEGI
ncbi:MAG: hypothetical protein WCS17_11065 [Prevotella sp.]